MCLAGGILQKGGKLPCPVDASGMFTSDVPDFKGQHVKVIVLANKPVCNFITCSIGCSEFFGACYVLCIKIKDLH